MKLSKKIMVAAAMGALATVAAAPAFAAEITPYASLRVFSGWDTNNAKYTLGGARPLTNTDFDLRNQANSRFGVKASDGNFAAQVELGIGGGGLSQTAATNGLSTNASGAGIGSGGNTFVWTRLAYGTYKFNAGTLLVGQAYSPYYAVSQQIAGDDNGNNGFGSLWDGRQPQIKFTLNNGLYIDLIRNAGTAATFGTSETLIPKIAIGYDGKAGNATFGAGVVGQVYKNQTAALQKNVFSAMGYAHAKVVNGPVNAGINLSLGRNTGDMGFAEGTAVAYDAVGNRFINNITFSALAELGYTISPSLKINTGVGYVSTHGGHVTSGTGYLDADNKISAFVQAPITLAKNVTVIPEFTYQDQMTEANATRGQRDLIYGAQWKFDF